MKSYKKNYIGKGSKVENMDIVKVTLKVEEVMKYKHEFEGSEYITFEVAQMQNPDKFGRTHTAYVSVREEEKQAETKAFSAMGAIAQPQPLWQLSLKNLFLNFLLCFSSLFRFINLLVYSLSI